MRVARTTPRIKRFATYYGVQGTAQLLPGGGGYVFRAAVSKEIRLASYNDPELVLMCRVGEEVDELERQEHNLLGEGF